jgi:hypothetical protein
MAGPNIQRPLASRVVPEKEKKKKKIVGKIIQQQ